MSGWLTSVTYALNHYVAVGENGTVLVSLDGISWDNVTLRSAGIPSTRLNVVRFNGTEFLTYGEHDAALRILLPPRLDSIAGSRDTDPWLRSVATGFGHIVVGGEAGISVFDPSDPFLVNRNSALVTTGVHNVSGLVSFRDVLVAVGAAGAILTSPNATMWTPQSSGTTASLNDVANFNNTLIAVGDGGTILSLDAGGNWIRRNSSSTSQLLGVAGSDTTAVAVGFGGSILRSTATPMLPTITLQPAGLAETVGGAASFFVRANGSLPLAYQWFRNGVPLAGETRSMLIRAPLSAADAADYSVTITNTAGTVSSSAARLNLLPAPAPVVDLSFHAVDSLVGSPTALLPLSGGSVLLAYGGQSNGDGIPRRLAKLRPDGALDPAWTITSFGVADPSSGAYVGTLAVQPDGRILVGGNFSTVNGQARNNLVRLNRDGTLDASFAPAPYATARTVFSIALQSDSRILIANSGLTPLRLLADGSLDSSFHPQPLTPGYTIFNELRNWSISMVALTADRKVLASAFTDLRFTNGFPIPKSQVVRFQSDGTLDASFTPLTWDGFNGDMRALDDGGALVIGALVPNGRPGAASESIWRLRGDGSLNPAYAMPSLPVIQASYIYSNGAVIFRGSSQQSPVRFGPFGAVDATFTGGIGQPSLIAATTDNQVYVAGPFEVYNGQPSHLVARLNTVVNESVNPPRILSFAADKTTASYGETVTLRAAVTGSADLTYEWVGVPVSYSNSTPVRTTSPVFTLVFSADGGGPTSTIKLVARNPSGEATSAPIVFTVLPDPPVVTSQPMRVSAQSGRDLSVGIQRNSTAGSFLEYEWRRNGQILATPPGGFLGPPLVIPKVTAADAGTYTITLRNALGVASTSAPIVVTIDDSSRLANLSTRAFVGPGEQTLIAGFSISGEQTRRVLIRAVGPALAKFGVTDALSDPQIRLINVASHTDYSVTFSSDGWDATSTDGNAFLRGEFSKVGAFPFDAGSRDNAGVAQIGPGNYTVQVTNKTGQGGTALVEIYEDDNDAARMLNVSSRAMVTPASPAICGLSIQGPVPKRVLLRGVGPGLSVFGISGVLSDPRLTLKDASAVRVSFNDRLVPAPQFCEMFKRTATVWGEARHGRFARLRIGIVGLGSVGSLVAEALARMGMTDVVLIDFDEVQEHNLDRLAGATEADIGKLKVEVAERHMRAVGTARTLRLHAVPHSIAEEPGYRAALDCDVLFSCVDRPRARSILNHFAYAHLIPCIDGGIAVRFRNGVCGGADWQLQTASPERPCLECLGAYDPSDVDTEKAGLLDDPTYLQNLDADHHFKRNENVFPFSMNLASLEIFHLMALATGVANMNDFGVQRFRFYPGMLDSDEEKRCRPGCPHCARIGYGDRDFCLSGRDITAEKARARQVARGHEP